MDSDRIPVNRVYLGVDPKTGRAIGIRGPSAPPQPWQPDQYQLQQESPAATLEDRLRCRVTTKILLYRMLGGRLARG